MHLFIFFTTLFCSTICTCSIPTFVLFCPICCLYICIVYIATLVPLRPPRTLPAVIHEAPSGTPPMAHPSSLLHFPSPYQSYFMHPPTTPGPSSTHPPPHLRGLYMDPLFFMHPIAAPRPPSISVIYTCHYGIYYVYVFLLLVFFFPITLVALCIFLCFGSMIFASSVCYITA